MLTRYMPIYLVVLLAFVCVAYGQQQSAADPQKTNSPAQNGKPAPGIPQPPLKLPPLKTPTPDEVKESEGPVLSAAPDSKVLLPAEKGFPGLPQGTGPVSISDHDVDTSRDIMNDLIGQSVTDQGLDIGVRSPDSAFMDALDPVLKKIGVPEIVGDAVKGGSLLLDSEPTADHALDYPDSVRYGQSVLSNLGSVAAGSASPFGDPSLIQACNRLRSYFTQYQFELNATQQAQVQNVIATNCSQQLGGGVQAGRPTSGANSNFPATSTPPGTVSPKKQQPTQVPPCVMYHYACNK